MNVTQPVDNTQPIFTTQVVQVTATFLVTIGVAVVAWFQKKLTRSHKKHRL